jgi:hypothetical protein
VKIIERDMKVTDVNQLITFRRIRSQASFNSDGVLTIRNYDPDNKSMDEIIIFTKSETEAVVHLMSEIGRTLKNNTLPF